MSGLPGGWRDAACFGDATHTSLVYTQKAEMAPVTTGVLSSTKCVLLLREIVRFFFWLHQTVWSSKEVHSGRVIAHCL